MKAHWTRRLATLLIAAVATFSPLAETPAAPSPEVTLARPTPQQAAWQDLELGLFMEHYSGPGSPEGAKWLPGECDVPIRQGTWMWEPNTAGRLFTVNQLLDRYYRSVGHNCNLLLNANPDPDGLIDDVQIHNRTLAAQEVATLAGESARAADPNEPIDRTTLDAWAAPYRGWHYHPDPVIPSDLKIPGHEKFHSFDVPTVYQIQGQPGKWFMSFIGFNGQGYNSFVAESTNLVQWTHPRLAMGFGPPNEFDHGGCVIGAFLYESYDIKAPRLLKPRDGKYWTLYGCYPRQGGYELRPGYEGVAVSDDGLRWRRAKNAPILAVQDPDCGAWEKDCIYQPWLVEHDGRFYNFYNAANGGTEQMGGATSTNLLDWNRYPANPIVRNRPDGYDAQFCSDGKVFRDRDHWVMFYFGVGKGGAHILAAFSRDLLRWTAHPEPLYKAGGHPDGLDAQYAHKIALIHNPANDTLYLYYCAVGKEGTPGNKGRCVGLLTSRKLVLNQM